MILLEVNSSGSEDSVGDGLNGDDAGGGKHWNEPDKKYWIDTRDVTGDGVSGDGCGGGTSNFYYDDTPLCFEHIVTNAALTITYKRI